MKMLREKNELQITGARLSPLTKRNHDAPSHPIVFGIAKRERVGECSRERKSKKSGE